MRKNKQFVAGFVTCVILLSVIFISGFAEDALTVMLNRFPIFINGQEEPVEAYNINGFTFLKLADVGKAIPGTTVKFNEIDERIEINSAEASLQETIDESEVQSMSETTIAQTPDGITQIDTWEGKQYIGFIYIKNKIKEKGYDFVKNVTSPNNQPITYGMQNNIWRITKNDEVILDNIPTTFIYGADEVEVNYYINTILPLIQ